MSEDSKREAVYARAGIGRSVTPGDRPAVLVVDLSHGFTDPESRLGANLDREVQATRELLDVARERGVPAVFTTVAFDGSGRDAGLWPQKIPSLEDLRIGTRLVEIDDRLGRREDEPVIVKKAASAFFGTNLSSVLSVLSVNGVVLCGATTSGCIRATAIDLLQHGFPAIVPRECVGDRARGPHEANLIDIQAKYADVVSLETALEYLATLPGNSRPTRQSA